MATLVIVMVLFFIVSLVAAYTSRNLIFEQRTSANQYRSTQAFEAAEAGVEWTLAMLNGGRIDDECLPSTDPTDKTFRDRYLSNRDDQPAIQPDGNIEIRMRDPAVVDMAVVQSAPRPGPQRPMPACIFDPDLSQQKWTCLCPARDVDAAVPSITSVGAKPMFRIRFEFIPSVESTRRDIVRIVSAGCTRQDADCLLASPKTPAGDAMAIVTSLIALRSGLTTPPGAPVVARGTLDAGTGPLLVTNTDDTTGGVTMIAGGAITGTRMLIAGSPGADSAIEIESVLAGLSDFGTFSAADRMFASVFGMMPGTYSQQPATLRVDCSTACEASAVNAVVAANPGRMVWLDGDLAVDGDIGTAALPAVIVVTGNATLSSGTFFGVLYSRAPAWNFGAGTTLINGAVIAEGSLAGSGTQTIVYDAALLNQMRTQHGSFVRVPGGWRDFQ